MPFNSETGKENAAKRWNGKDPATVRSRSVKVVVSNAELAMMDAKAAAKGISRTELIIKAVQEYKV